MDNARYSPELVPELELSFHADLAAAEGDDGDAAYFTNCWPAVQTLARYVLDHPTLVAGARVLDFGTGAGIVALAAKRAGAREVVGIDRDRRAVEALRRDAARLELDVVAHVADPLATPLQLGTFDVVLAGDVLYDHVRDRVWPWLLARATEGAKVCVADPGRLPRPFPGMRHVFELVARGGVTCTVYEVIGR